MGGNREEGQDRQPKEMAPGRPGSRQGGDGGERGGQGAREGGSRVGWAREGGGEVKGGEKGYENSLDWKEGKTTPQLPLGSTPAYSGAP